MTTLSIFWLKVQSNAAVIRAGQLLGLSSLAVLLCALVGCGDDDDPCESVEQPVCDDGFEAIPFRSTCLGGDGTVSGISEWICVAEDIGNPCDASGGVDVCGSELLCTSEPGQTGATVGTCLPTCANLDGDCSVLGGGWECVTTSNGPDVCAADWSQ